jgi:enterochelin esterase family protein
MIEPGERVGDMALTTAQNEGGTEPQLFDFCDPYITESDPATITRECEVPAMPYYFIGYGIFADTTSELDAQWPTMAWELILDGHPVNLAAFGTMDLDWGQQFRFWNVVLENPTPGEHTIRYTFSEFGDPTDATWVFTVASPAAMELPEDAESLVFVGSSNEFGTLADFDSLLRTAIQSDQIDPFWDMVVATGQMPLIFDDFAVFLYRGQADSVVWRGDFAASYERQGQIDLWLMMKQFETDARLDYEILLNSSDYILDPLNPFIQVGGFGPKSVVRMPEYVYPEFALSRDDVEHGSFSEDFTITSQNLGYDVNYRVYTAARYETLENLPVIYVTDGQDYANPEMGAMVNALDNLIADERIKPVIAVFIDPRDPTTGDNRRRQELVPDSLDTCPFCDFVALELAPTIDAVYKTDPSPDARALVGFSLGGMFTAHMGLAYGDVFHQIAIQSPYVSGEWIFDTYQEADRLPLRVFLSHGTYDEGAASLRLRDILETRDYPLLYIETHDGHSYGNVRGLLDDMLIYVFGVE